MNNYLVAGYTVFWIVIFSYGWFLSSRQKTLQRKLEELKDMMKDSSRPIP